MSRNVISLLAAMAGIAPMGLAQAQNATTQETPISSHDQAMDQRNRVPESFETIIIAADEKSRERAMLLIEL